MPRRIKFNLTFDYPTTQKRTSRVGLAVLEQYRQSIVIPMQTHFSTFILYEFLESSNLDQNWKPADRFQESFFFT